MQGLRFMIIDEQGTPINQGVILDIITPERYRCFFARKPAMQRVVTLTEIEGWNLFNTDEELGIFMAAIAPLQMPVVPESEPEPPKKKAKKKGTK